nr:hypothetical protein GCM10020092_049840 [Actinoplanes digitatis]
MPSRAAELGREAVVADLGEPPACGVQAGQPARGDQAERGRQRLLEQRAAGDEGVPVLPRQRGGEAGRGGQVGKQRLQRALGDEHRGGVHDVLAGGTAVHEADGVARHGRAQPRDQRDDRVAGGGGLGAQLAGVHDEHRAGRGDGLGVGAGRQPGPRRRPGQGRLGVEQGAHPGGVADLGPDAAGREHAVEEPGVLRRRRRRSHRGPGG